MAESLSWNELAETLVVGAVRGMAEAHIALKAAAPGAIPSLTELTMYQAAEVLAATLLEDSVGCQDTRDLPKASRIAGRNMLDHLRALRRQRENSGDATLSKVIASAGLGRQRAH